ncbi:MAG: hypothetical protein E7644_06430 [Ruminococcaceae bacterium]|nr:hypothetical protein [Oscillospiraceae bacterium]
MQLTAPAFLLIFLPISLLLTLPVPKKHRSKALAVISVVWYVLVNRENPWGLAAVFLLALFAYAMVLPRPELMRRTRLFFGTVLPLSLLLAARIFAEYGAEGFRYPYGLTFVVLAAISATVDRVNGKCDVPRSVFDFAVYLFFFPLLFLGPLLHFRHFQERLDTAAPSVERFATGVRLYMGGTIKYLAVSAVLFRSLSQIIAYSEGLHYLTALLLPLLAFGSFWFLLAGCSDISRGVSYMYGFAYPKSHRVGFLTREPFRLVFGAYHALYVYLKHYVIAPISRRCRGVVGRVLSLLILLSLYGLFFRTRPEALLFLLPLFLFLLPATVWPKLARPVRKPTAVLIAFGGCLLLSPFLLALAFEQPLDLIALVGTLGSGVEIYQFYYVFSAVLNTRYLLISLLLAAIFLPISYYRGLWERRLRGGKQVAFRYVELVLLFGGFLLTLVYFLPQFPSYAELPYLNFYL